MRDLRDPQNGCQIWTPSIKVKFPFEQLGVVLNNYSDPLMIKDTGTCIPKLITQH